MKINAMWGRLKNYCIFLALLMRKQCDAGLFGKLLYFSRFRDEKNARTN